jgi:hypothetical protein
MGRNETPREPGLGPSPVPSRVGPAGRRIGAAAWSPPAPRPRPGPPAPQRAAAPCALSLRPEPDAREKSEKPERRAPAGPGADIT